MTVQIKNKDARNLWLSSHLLSQAPTGPLDVMKIIRQLGFVQLDTIQVVARAHHHILWSRNQNYREDMFDPLLAKERAVFEHFTHDASILPMETLPYWRRQFDRKRSKIDRANWYSGMLDENGRQDIKDRIRAEGALSTHAFETKRKDPKVVWSRPPHKLALDYMWLAGELATCYRENFKKYYNLPERVFPAQFLEQSISEDQQIEWLCSQALDRLGFATASEIQKFWEAISLNESRDWVRNNARLVPVSIEGADGIWRDATAIADIEERITNLLAPTTRMRILNPFDPAIRDRDRLKKLFGLDYKIEIFVPAAKRKFGYYVYPLLEGTRFVGRIEVATDRQNRSLELVNLWTESGIKWSAVRQAKLESELSRLARFIGCKFVRK